ncbi:helix-turn-helix domain-containing protein [Methylobacterium sp. W2]|nr:helix-turn-helix domain-containing protein [Methylobacterium sp. W2]
MENVLGAVIAQARKARKMTQTQVASAFGISRPAVGQWESGETSPGTDRLGALAELLQIDLSAALRGEVVLLGEQAEAPAASGPANARIRNNETVPDTAALKGPRNVPVYGTGSGGPGGDFRFNGQTIDHAPRPPGIESRRDVYVVYVVGDSVSPKYEDGDPVYVDPHRRPQPRDYVVVELHPDEHGEPGDAFVKRLVKRTPTKLVVEQHTPAKEIVFEEADVLRVHRVIPYPELIGI